MSVVPKTMVTLFGKRIPALVLLYVGILVGIVVSIVFPWIFISVVFVPELAELSAEGSMSITAYVWGTVIVAWSYVVHELGGASKPPESGVLHLYANSFIAFFSILLIALAIYAILILVELEKIKTRFLSSVRSRFVMETVAVSLMMILSILFAHLHNAILLSPENVRIVAEKMSLYESGKGVANIYAHTRTSWCFSWGTGFIVFLVTTIFAMIIYFDRYFLKGTLNLSMYWRVRGHMLLVAYYLLALPLVEAIVSRGVNMYHTWTGLFYVVYLEEGVYLSFASSSFVIMFIIMALMIVLFLLGTMVFPSRYVMKAEPFITLALSDEEIIRRHKILPIAIQWRKSIDLLISILSFFALAFFYVGIVRELGYLSVIIYYIEHMGMLWTTPAAYILTCCVILQALLILKPTK